MKKFVIGCSLFCFIALQASAQTSTFVKGDNIVSLGVGFGGYNFGNYYTSSPYFTGYFERCFIDNLFDEKSSLGFGATIGYKSNKYEISGYGWKYTYLLFGVRGAFHYAFVDKLDTYAGMMMGYRGSSYKEIGNAGNVKPSNWGGLTSDFYVGARYYFTDNFGAFLELGYSWFSIGTIGVSVKF